jgi:very-short-patch-repair endonuclease
VTDPDIGGRQIPWLRVVQFHKEIVARAEQGFFSLNGRDPQSDRWTSLAAWEPGEMSGPWRASANQLVSQAFRLALEQKQHESIYLGGPCYLGWTRGQQGSWMPQWRPIFFREVELRAVDASLEAIPKEGVWTLSPMVAAALERLEMNVGDSVDELTTQLLEKALVLRNHSGLDWATALREALVAHMPGIEQEVSRAVERDTFPVTPSPWVLFAPTTTFGALTRHLMRDYERLEKLLEAEPGNIGGLRLLEDRPAPEDDAETVDVLPLIPLNETQRMPVKAILSGRPLTVVSGPPGTGKSQVVVSLLLNAWAKGKTVLFASNNNKAVDVVRERVERFETQLPIAVRAGSQQKQNIRDVLRRILALVSHTRRDGFTSDERAVATCRAALESERYAVQSALRTSLPQRIDEAKATALRAYAEYKALLSKVAADEQSLLEELRSLGFDPLKPNVAISSLKVTQSWLDSLPDALLAVREDERTRAVLNAEIAELERIRDQAAASCGLRTGESAGWGWLISGPSPDIVDEWEERLRKYLAKPVEQALEDVEWSADFDRWRSEGDARDWAASARSFSDEAHGAIASLIPRVAAVRTAMNSLQSARGELEALAVDPERLASISAPLLRGWIGAFAEISTVERQALDWLPWSRASRLERRLRTTEAELRAVYPLEVWKRVGVLDSEGRARLAPIVETSSLWLERYASWTAMQGEVEAIGQAFANLRVGAAGLRFKDIPETPDPALWQPILRSCDVLMELAERAAVAWCRRSDRAAVEAGLREIARDWPSLANGLPILEAWKGRTGSEFDLAIRSLSAAPNADAVKRVRSLLYAGGIGRLREGWTAARDAEQRAIPPRRKLEGIPTLEDRQRQWWASRPRDAFVLSSSMLGWPDLTEPNRIVAKVVGWRNRWSQFCDELRPAAHQASADEYQRACSKLKQAAALVPDGTEKTKLVAEVDELAKSTGGDWPLEALNMRFTSFSPSRMRARIEAMEAELEKLSFEDAKVRWLQRLRGDEATVRAIDSLEKLLARHRNVVPESEFGSFRRALKGVLIWVTTAQAAQAIPLEPELFDIVVIDEASQCTLTNLLPLMYRGKALAVIGDDNQLPAIPTIQEAEELSLARKYEIEEFLSVVGHATNDVYKTAAESLPGRRADVMMLTEHFRCHPQIIGFSNRYIYLQRLELKKDPTWGQRLPVGSGVHLRAVSGIAERGENGRSWQNKPEAEGVLALIKELRASNNRGLSFGVVTPFAAQKELLRERLDKIQLASEVLVDTAYGFQGDERDVMIFSPVVARGITGSASRWVENPPNLINVAITRAREAIFFVGDVDYCCQQDGILRKLGLYCKDVDLLRRTSNAELELFSWMVVKGWEPRVHPRIGDIEVDFVLRSKSAERIVVEVDGSQHQAATAQDAARDAFLASQGYKVLRTKARDVLETPFDVIHQIDGLLSQA